MLVLVSEARFKGGAGSPGCVLADQVQNRGSWVALGFRVSAGGQARG